MNNHPEAVVTFGRPFLSAKVLPHCTACDGGFLIDGPDASARPCGVCAPAVEAAKAIRAARMPAVALFAAGPTVGAPSAMPMVHRREWDRARARLLACVASAVEMDRGEPTGIPTTLAGVSGAAGSGKTWLLVHALSTGIRRGLQGLYVPVGDPLAAFGMLGSGDLGAGVRMAQRVPLLALDDIGGHRNATASGIVRDIVATRADRLMPTLFTTSRGPAEIRDDFGPSVADQVSAAVVTLLNGSLRGGGA